MDSMTLMIGGAVILVIVGAIAYWYFYIRVSDAPYTGPRANTWTNIGEGDPAANQTADPAMTNVAPAAPNVPV